MTSTDDTAWQAILDRADGARRTGRMPEHDTAELGSMTGATALYRNCYGDLLDAMIRTPLVIAQLGQSLDGRIATTSGSSHYISCPESLDHLHRLRALVDAVIIGATTLERDNPRLTTRRVTGRNPVRVIIDPNGRANPDLQTLNNGDAPTLIVTAPGARILGNDACDTVQLEPEDGVIPPAAILSSLRARGLRTVLVEGGAVTLSRFLEAGLIDRFHIMVAPLILGSGYSGVRLPPISRVSDGVRPAVRTYQLGADTLFDCDLRKSGRGSA